VAELREKNETYFKDSTFYLSAGVFSAGISFLTLPVYTRYLSPEDYGVFALFLLFGNVLASLLSFGLNTASYRFYFSLKDDSEGFRILNSTNLIFILCIYLFFGSFIFLYVDWVSLFLFDGRISGNLLLLSYVSGCLEYFFSYIVLLLTAQNRAIVVFFIAVSRIVINTILSLYFIFVYSYTYLARIYATIITQIIIVLCLLVLIRKIMGFILSFLSLKKSITFSYTSIPNSIISLLYSSFDKTMLNKNKGLTSVGYYEIGAKFGSLMKILMDSLGKSWSPFFMRKSHENTVDAKNEITCRFIELAFIYMVCGFWIICFSEEMIKLLTTKSFYPAMYVVPAYVYFYLFGIIGQLATNQIMVAEKMHYLLPSNVVSIVLNIILNILLIPKYGAVGAAIATAIASLCSSIVLGYFGSRLYPLPTVRKRLLGMYALIMIFTVVVYLIMSTDFNFSSKVAIKIILFFFFVGCGFLLKYISLSPIIGFIKRVIIKTQDS
jgi:O-antigen/teichoic acid export membrane protein